MQAPTGCAAQPSSQINFVVAPPTPSANTNLSLTFPEVQMQQSPTFNQEYCLTSSFLPRESALALDNATNLLATTNTTTTTFPTETSLALLGFDPSAAFHLPFYEDLGVSDFGQDVEFDALAHLFPVASNASQEPSCFDGHSPQTLVAPTLSASTPTQPAILTLTSPSLPVSVPASSTEEPTAAEKRMARRKMNRSYQQASRTRKAAMLAETKKQNHLLQYFALSVRQLIHKDLFSAPQDLGQFVRDLVDLELRCGLDLEAAASQHQQQQQQKQQHQQQQQQGFHQRL